MADSTAGRLGQKLGPLPVWGWAVLAVGLYFGYRFLAGNSGGSSGAAPVGVVYPTGSQATSGGSSDTGVGGSSGGGTPVDNLSGDYLSAYGELVDSYGGINSALLGGLLASEQSVIQQGEVNGSLLAQLVGSLTDISTSAIERPPIILEQPEPIILGAALDFGSAPAIPSGTMQPATPSLVESAGNAVAPANSRDGGAAGSDATDWVDYPIMHFPPVGAVSPAPSQSAAKAASGNKAKTTTHGGVTTTQTNVGPYGKKPLE